MNEETRADFLLPRAHGHGRSAARSTTTASSRSRRRSCSRATAARSPARSSTHHNELDQTLYLRIATELYLKRLIVGGLERVYEIGKDFRNEGVSYKHNPEFTMLEWYEAYADYRDTMDRMERLVDARRRRDARHDDGHLPRPRDRPAAAGGGSSSSTRSPSTASGRATRPSCARSLERARRRHDPRQDLGAARSITPSRTSSSPALIQPTILYDYPVELSPFARPTDEDGIVERFEYYVGGMELGNAFTEINDSEEQAARFAMQAAEGAGGNVEAEPGDPDYVEALSYGMPPTGGLGMGIDRLAMVLLGKDSIRDVILFPALREPPLTRLERSGGRSRVRTGPPTGARPQDRSPGYHDLLGTGQSVRVRRNGGREASTCSRDSQNELARSLSSRRTRRGR